MRILIFGGNRYVGRRVATRLLAEGNQVTLVHRSDASVPGAETIRGDRHERSVLDRALRGHPDVILDMSLYTSAAARVTMEALAERSVRYLAVSTAAIYSQRAPTPWNESSPVDPAPGWGLYGKEKAAADSVVLSAGLPEALVLRPVYIVGTGDPDRRCERLFSLAARRLPVSIPGDGSATVQVIDVDTMAEILIWLLNVKTVGVLDIPGATISVRGFIEDCVELIGGSSDLRFVAKDSKQYQPDEWPFPDLDLWVQGERLRSECSIEPPPLAQILAKAHEEWVGGTGSHRCD